SAEIGDGGRLADTPFAAGHYNRLTCHRGWTSSSRRIRRRVRLYQDHVIFYAGDLGRLGTGAFLIRRSRDVVRDAKLRWLEAKRHHDRFLVSFGAGMGESSERAEDDDITRARHHSARVDVAHDHDVALVIHPLAGTQRPAQIERRLLCGHLVTSSQGSQARGRRKVALSRCRSGKTLDTGVFPRWSRLPQLDAKLSHDRRYRVALSFGQTAPSRIEAESSAAKEVARFGQLRAQLRDCRFDAGLLVNDDGDTVSATLEHDCLSARHFTTSPTHAFVNDRNRSDIPPQASFSCGGS